MTVLRVLVLLALAASAAACGQKGPLVLPDAQHPRKKVKLPAAPKLPSSTTPDASPRSAAPASAPDGGAGPAQNAAPPVAAPETNATPNPGPQA
jgi:predicted small lipoprotein YifL